MGDGINFQMRKYNLLHFNGDSKYPKKDEIDLINKARKDAKGAWSSVLQDDELTSIMVTTLHSTLLLQRNGSEFVSTLCLQEDGDAFSGFLEPMPLFAPTYKRRKGDIEGDCGDYTDPIRIIHGFTNTGTVEEEMVVTQRAFYQQNNDKVGVSQPSQKELRAESLNSSPEKFKASTNTVQEETTTADSEEKLDDENLDQPPSPIESMGSERLRRKATAIASIESDSATDNKQSRISMSTGTLHESLNTIGQSLSTLHLVRKQIDPRALRPPSYTDRILYHSLPDQAGRLKVQAYDLCDQLRVSDHRAVSMVVLLEVIFEPHFVSCCMFA